MKEIKKSKDIYDAIKVPAELSSVIEQAVLEHKKENGERNIPITKKRKAWIPVAAAAILVIGITIGLNTNEAFAKSAGELPIIGSLAKVLTIRDYQSEDNVNVTIEQPEIVVDDTHTASETTEQKNTSPESKPEGETDTSSSVQYVADVNAAIEKIVADYKADATKRIEEYKEAFLATGGTEEEWLKRGAILMYLMR